MMAGAPRHLRRPMRSAIGTVTAADLPHETPPRRGPFAPLAAPLFRRVWIAGLLSNFGVAILGVAAAWGMTQMTQSATMVALVQTALMLPVGLFALLSGAIADMFDRRKVAIAALWVSILGSTALTGLALAGAMTPSLLLAFCFVAGCGMAMLWPAWAASVSELAPADLLPAAVALNGVSFNVARSLGPALGGVLVAAAGGGAAFAVTALASLPLLGVMMGWRRTVEPARLPPETLGRAMVSGLRYVANAPAIRTVILRTFLTGFAGGSALALLPIIVRDLLGGEASLYGMLLAAFGVGALTGALNIGRARAAFSAETVTRLAALTMAVAAAVVAMSAVTALTIAALFAFGLAWTGMMMTCNVTVQTAAPRWVAARALAAFQASVSAGAGLGGWIWGLAANAQGVSAALLMSAGLLALVSLLGRWAPMPQVDKDFAIAARALEDPEVRLSITPRSGPIIVEIEYRVALDQARAFYDVMRQVQSSRQRNGAYGWSIARDIADPQLWIERYHCPTWHDYLRLRNRPTQAERELHERAGAFHVGPEPVRIHRMLERPIGSVRWLETTPDRDHHGPNGPTPGGH